MRAGSLRKIGTLQSAATARDSTGSPVTSWADVCPVRYAVQTNTGRLVDSGGVVREVQQTTITMRCIPGVAVLGGMRIRSSDGRFYRITTVNDVNLLHHELELTVVEGMGAS